MPTVIVDQDSTDAVLADQANTKYIVKQGVDITPSIGYTIDARAAVDNRTFQINGHLGGSSGINLDFQNDAPSGTRIVVGKTGLIDASSTGITGSLKDGVIINHGTIHSQTGIFTIGRNHAIENTGEITSDSTGVRFGGTGSELTNSGDITGVYGVIMNSFSGEKDSFHNSGIVTGSLAAITAYDGADDVFNTGKIKGDVSLGKGKDLYDGRGGVIVGEVDAGLGNDVLKGGNKIDIFDGGAGNDKLSGGGNSDVFIFSTGSDADKISDFNAKGAAHDVIDLSEMAGFDSFDDLAGHMKQQGDNAVLNFGNGDVLKLKDVDVTDLTIADFVF